MIIYLKNRNNPCSINELQKFVEENKGVEALPMDISYLDAYDHIITILLNQADEDKKFGIPWSNGPIKARIY